MKFTPFSIGKRIKKDSLSKTTFYITSTLIRTHHTTCDLAGHVWPQLAIVGVSVRIDPAHSSHHLLACLAQLFRTGVSAKTTLRTICN